MTCGGIEQGYRLIHQGAIALGKVESQGIRIDEGYLVRAIEETDEKIEELSESLHKSDVMKAWIKKYQSATKLGSRVQLAWVLTNHLGMVFEKTSKGQDKTDESALAESHHPFVKDYLQLIKLKKAVNTYLRGIQKETVNGFLYPFFNLHRVRTFRSSSDSPNFQNMPVRDPEIGSLVRRAFIPRKGCVLMEADYSSIEVRIAACYHRDPVMLAYINDTSKDLHRDMAAECYLLSKSEVTGEIRYFGKNQFVFPQFYGSWYVSCAEALWDSAKGLKTASGISLRKHLQSKGIRTLGVWERGVKPRKGTFLKHLQEVEDVFWGRRFRVYRDWRRSWYESYQKRGFIDLLSGFRCRGFMRKNEVVNYAVQGSAFHCLLWSLIQLVMRDLPRTNLRSLIVGQIHDSVVGDVPIDEVEDYEALLQEVMTVRLKEAWKWIITPMDIEFSRYPEAWDKKAE